MIETFDAYVERGLKVIPLLPLSKKPFFDNWQDASRYDAAACRRILARGDYNLGLLLGDIVDVEGDDEPANQRLDELIGDVPHPRYRSSKSVHHLFLTPDQNLTRLVVGKIEFRGRNHQSVIPPSRHEDGTVYKWLPGRGFPIPEMPPKLLKFFRKANTKGVVKHNHVMFDCPFCRSKVVIEKSRLRYERQACEQLKLTWRCNKCRTYDLRPLVRQLKRRS